MVSRGQGGKGINLATEFEDGSIRGVGVIRDLPGRTSGEPVEQEAERRGAGDSAHKAHKGQT